MPIWRRWIRNNRCVLAHIASAGKMLLITAENSKWPLSATTEHASHVKSPDHGSAVIKLEEYRTRDFRFVSSRSALLQFQICQFVVRVLPRHSVHTRGERLRSTRVVDGPLYSTSCARCSSTCTGVPSMLKYAGTFRRRVWLLAFSRWSHTCGPAPPILLINDKLSPLLCLSRIGAALAENWPG